MNILLNNNSLKINKCWDEFIDRTYIKNEIDNIITKIGNPITENLYSQEINDIEDYYFPESNKVFRFLENDINNIKYIILGMDPYPSYYIEDDIIKPIATGRSFEVSNIKSFKDKYKQKSLSMILKTLYYDKYNINIDINQLRSKIIEIDNTHSKNIIKKLKTKIDSSNTEVKVNLKIEIEKEVLNELNINYKGINKNKNIIIFNPTSFFDITELQGILWLNSTLTVKANKSNSHTEIWKNFMDELIKYIKNQNKNIKYVLFGNNAINRVKNIIDKKNIISTCHPATRVNNNFIEQNCFKKMNDILLYL